MKALTPYADAVVEWGIRASLLTYMAGARDFEVETTGGATFSLPAGARMTGRVDEHGVLRLDGSVVLRAHLGALLVPLIDVRIDGRALTIADPASSDGSDDERLALVDLVPPEVEESDPGTIVFGTRLASTADALFMFNYLPGSDFDPLRIRVNASEMTPPVRY